MVLKKLTWNLKPTINL